MVSVFFGKRCVVTGGLGFIGSSVVHRLVSEGATVTVIDACVPQHGGDIRNIAGLNAVDVIEKGIGDSAILPAIEAADYVFNIAGQVSHLESMHDPLRDLELNARSHLAFLELLRHNNPAAVVVHTSTRQVYGRPQYLPVDELHPANPVDVNGVNKLAGEQFHMLYHQVYGMATCALRLTNVYGPRQCLTRDGLGFLPVFVRRALAGEDIVVYGDGQQFRDCLYIDDVVDALLVAATTPEAYGEIINLGHDTSLSLLEIAQIIVKAAGSKSTVSCIPWPEEHAQIDIGSFQGDFKKAGKLLGWSPTTPFESGIRKTLDFYKEGG
jgi:UDP-glucose 4-epimerase